MPPNTTSLENEKGNSGRRDILKNKSLHNVECKQKYQLIGMRSGLASTDMPKKENNRIIIMHNIDANTIHPSENQN